MALSLICFVQLFILIAGTRSINCSGNVIFFFAADAFVAVATILIISAVEILAATRRGHTSSSSSTMAWDSRRNYQSARIGSRDFWLVPKGEVSDGFPLREQAKPAELLRYNDLIFKEYKYDNLPQDKKRIRLMKLYPGEVSGTEIYCELVEVEYDRQFHIPTYIQKDETEADENGGSRDNSKNGNNTSTEAEESDLATRGEEKPETEDERKERIKRQAVREVWKIVDDLKDTKEKREAKKKSSKDQRTREWEKAKKNEVQYEALSWCWGRDDEDYAVLIKKGRTTYKKRVRKELALALKYLRRAGRERMLWIDAICINQANPNERNHQVQMMSRVYTRARKVCIWLGEADADSETAIRFIKDEMRELKHFDTITTDEQYSRKWQALMSLMQRDWFFRRWVVQEIALASAAKVYCGPHSVPWRSFAVAVELFVEVETATHRLSEVMKRDEKFRHVPGWFEYVSELGASLLVQATGKVFRTKRTPMQQDVDTSDEESEEAADKREKISREEYKEQKKRVQETHTIDPLERRSLLSLEYLVSTMFIFQTSEPRDVAYALLAIARDASPFAPAHFGQEDQKLFLVMTLLDRFLAEKPFVVDYTRPYSDVSRDFVEFSIARTHKTDPHQALDILCRPWALEPPRKRSNRLPDKTREGDDPKKRLMPERRTWKKLERQVEKNDNGPGGEHGRHPKYRYNIGDHPWDEDKRKTNDYRTEFETKDKEWRSSCITSGCTHEDASACVPPEWTPSPGWDEIKARYFSSSGNSDPAEQDISLPSWVARASQAPFMLDHAPGMDMRKTSRANADPLVGPPQDGHRNYNAAGSEKLDLSTLKFKKRPVLHHYSLYVKGFELDVVDRVEDASQLGSIPRAWLELGGWTDLNQDPPDDFWRTIVADRGRDNRNPPYYYARACQESVHKGGHLGGSVNTTALINDEQNSIIAEFCRRVHAVIWNRCLFKTKNNRLGLATKVKEGDKVCILYGCTVPVILGETRKNETSQNATKEADLDLEAEEDRVEALKACIRRAINNRERKAKYNPKKKGYKTEEWQEMMDARQAYLEERRRERDGTHQEQTKNAKEKEEWKIFCMEQAKKIKEVDEKIEKAKKELAVRRDEEKPGKPVTDIVGLEKTLEAAEKEKTNIREVIKNAAVSAKQSDDPPSRSDNGRSTTGTSTTSEIQADGASITTSPDKDPQKDPRNFWYEFKGECYLHGMMDGEAMREKFYKDLQDWEFELR